MAKKILDVLDGKADIEAITHKDGFIGADLNFMSREAYKLLRTNVTYSFASSDSSCKVIGLTSPVPNEGKSYTSINLAYTYAIEGKRTLLINGDLRNPSYSRFFNQSEDPGLSSYFLDSKTEIIRKNVLTDNLDVIFAGPIPPNPGELLGSKGMGEYLETLKKSYDYIIIDLPPVNVVSDALIISKYLDGVIVVVRHNFSHKKDVYETISQLKFVKANILGFVYNDFSHKRSSYSSKYRYYKKSMYGYGGYAYGYGESKHHSKKEGK